MPQFFIDRPIVAMVIAILTVLIGGIAILDCRSRNFPTLSRRSDTATFVGADAQTLASRSPRPSRNR